MRIPVLVWHKKTRFNDSLLKSIRVLKWIHEVISRDLITKVFVMWCLKPRGTWRFELSAICHETEQVIRSLRVILVNFFNVLLALEVVPERTRIIPSFNDWNAESHKAQPAHAAKGQTLSYSDSAELYYCNWTICCERIKIRGVVERKKLKCKVWNYSFLARFPMALFTAVRENLSFASTDFSTLEVMEWKAF